MAKNKEGKLQARCSSELENNLIEFAEKDGRKPSELIRLFVQAGISGNQVTDVRPLVKALDQLTREMSRVGGNLNQIAHYFNIRDKVDESKLAKNHKLLQANFKLIIKQIKAIRRELTE